MGFLFLHALIIEKGRIETTWTVLRKFGCNDNLKLTDAYLSIPNKKAPYQSVALTSEAVEFLKGIFSTFDDDKLSGKMEELKAYKQQQAVKVENLETKLVEAEQEIYRLENRCMILESASNPLATLSRNEAVIGFGEIRSNLNESSVMTDDGRWFR